MGNQRYVYEGDFFPRVGIDPRTYIPNFFSAEIELESTVFYELRKQNGFLPHQLSDSSSAELDEIDQFFRAHSETFFFLFEESVLIGSILLLGNYVQSMAISPRYQRKGYGAELTKYGINYAYEHGHRAVELDVMSGNVAAEQLYEKLGFRKKVD